MTARHCRYCVPRGKILILIAVSPESSKRPLRKIESASRQLLLASRLTRDPSAGLPHSADCVWAPVRRTRTKRARLGAARQKVCVRTFIRANCALFFFLSTQRRRPAAGHTLVGMVLEASAHTTGAPGAPATRAALAGARALLADKKALTRWPFFYFLSLAIDLCPTPMSAAPVSPRKSPKAEVLVLCNMRCLSLFHMSPMNLCLSEITMGDREGNQGSRGHAARQQWLESQGRR
jgi:hypothetical protein